jgi:beta-lactamase regulating signal transducer with metallopeptidase domain
MILETFLDLLVNLNLIVFASAVAFLIVEACLTILGFRKSFSTRLWLLKTSLGFAALLSLLSYFGSMTQFRASPHISDILISQYLKGNISISAVNFDNLLSARTFVLQAVHSGTNYWANAAIFLIMASILGRCTYIFINVIRINKILRNGHCIRRSRLVDIVISSETNVPFTTRGVRKFYAVIPETLIDDYRTLSIALGHEFQHIRQKDVTIEFLIALCSPLLILNPGFWIISQKIRKLREHICDVEYLSRSRVTAREYAKALLSVAKQASLLRRMSHIGSLSVPFVGRGKFMFSSTKSQLASRVLALADSDNRKPHKFFACSLLAFASALTLICASAFLPNQGWSHDRIMISSVANLERLSFRNQTQKTTTDAQ